MPRASLAPTPCLSSLGAAVQVLGTAFIAGGIRNKAQRFNQYVSELHACGYRG